MREKRKKKIAPGKRAKKRPVTQRKAEPYRKHKWPIDTVPTMPTKPARPKPTKPPAGKPVRPVPTKPPAAGKPARPMPSRPHPEGSAKPPPRPRPGYGFKPIFAKTAMNRKRKR